MDIVILIPMLNMFQSKLQARHYPRCFPYVNQYILHDSPVKYYDYAHVRDRETEAHMPTSHS